MATRSNNGFEPTRFHEASRLPPLDALRGLIILLMALDHANFFIAHGKREPELWAGAFPNYRHDALAFLTRFVTHMAAPGFFFLLGVGMVLLAASRYQRGWSNGRIVRHFVVRGLLLILLQFLVENRAWNIGQPPNPTIYFGVLYCLGMAMMLGTLLLLLSTRWLVGLSVLLVVTSTELLLPETRTGFTQYQPVLRLLLLPGYTQGMMVLYPVLPWLGVTGLGMAFGRWLRQDREQAYRGALGLGAVALLLFIPVRLLGGFGNIRPMQRAGACTSCTEGWIAFLNLVKYPPSVTLLLLTLGADLVLLGLFARASQVVERGLRLLVVLGRVPLFFYVTHLYLYGYMGLWIVAGGTGIPGMYLYWLLGLLILFPLCLVYGRFKHRQPAGSLVRFL
jgi:uncharacterized membrane protein